MTCPINPHLVAKPVLMLSLIRLYSVYETLHTGAVAHLQT